MQNVMPCGALWGEPDNQLIHWCFLAGKMGATFPFVNPLLIGLRGIAPDNQSTHDLIQRPVYDDTFILIPPGENPIIFPGATHSYQIDSKLAPDVDGDKRGDVGSIRPAKYVLKDPGIRPYPIFILTNIDGTDKIPCWRDTDHNGVISLEEARRSEQTRTGGQVNSDGCYATSVLMHTGIDAPPDSDHRSSIACQTASLKWLQVMRDKCKSTKVIDYILMNANDAIEIFNNAKGEF